MPEAPDQAGRISFIICTRNRAASLRRALDSVAATARPHGDGIDLLVVDNGSTDDTRATVADWAATAFMPVRLIDQPRQGLAAARNAGMAAATGRLLAFTDDDCVLEPDYVAELLRHYDNDTVPVIRGGRVELGDPADLPYTIKVSEVPARMKMWDHPGLFLIGCNMVIPRAVTQVIGKFDERFGAGARFRASEETDYIYRAFRAGIAVEYVPNMVVRHFHGRRTHADIARLSAGYFVGNGAVYAKHFRDRPFSRWLWSHARMAAKELVRGQQMDAALGLTYRSLFFYTALGMAKYWLGPGEKRDRFAYESSFVSELSAQLDTHQPKAPR